MTSSSSTFARISEIDPSGRPGATLLRLRPSSGDTKPVRLSNIRMFDDRHGDHRAAKLRRVERLHDAHDGIDRRVLGGVDARREAEHRSIVRAVDDDDRELNRTRCRFADR